MDTHAEPKLDVETKYGTLTVTFLDPDQWGDTDSRGQKRSMRDKNVASVRGEIVVNRIPVTVSCRLSYGMVHYRAGKELETPELELAEDFQSSYHKRTDVNPFGSSVTDGIRTKLRDLWNSVIREAYEAHPELQRAAVRFRLAYTLERAVDAEAKARQAYEDAKRDTRTAQQALTAHDRAAR